MVCCGILQSSAIGATGTENSGCKGQRLTGANLSVIEFRSTLYQSPGRVEQEEAPRESLDAEAGFVVIVARREHV